MILGCDPGLQGALSLIDARTGRLLECVDVPTCANGLATGSMKRWLDAARLLELLRDWSARHDFAGRGCRGVIERPFASPNLPAQTVAAQFDTFGVIRASLQVVCDSVRPVDPKTWKKLYGVGADKEKARETALALYPTAPLGRVRDHNRAESILVAHWLLRTEP